MKLTFIGGTRFIGAAAVRRAAAAGHDVTVLHRGEHPNPNPDVRSVQVDRADPLALRKTLEKLAPDVVLDTRAMIRQDAETVVAAMNGLVPKLVVLSSCDVYAQFGRLNGLPAPPPEDRLTEDSPLTVPYPFRGVAEHPGGPDYDKKQVEAVCLAAVAKSQLGSVTCLRLPAVYGSGDYQRRFGGLVDALDGAVAEVTLPRQGGAWRWTHAHVEDVAHAIVLAAERAGPGGHVYNVGEAETPTMSERVEDFARELGVAVTWREVDGELPAAFGLLGRMECDLVVDSERIRRELGFAEVTSPEERVADLLAWCRATQNQ
ncbi:MAG: NAD-dependent dehydratase [Deltaproteobacteria bacterium CG_4_9_14_3_um_filter_63_12]|nr:MAG: NAD-dependent dehydratase [Deltaproteobacteria bacterium CG17_big_fil_post_rev_8_21_14_2_50_63_7]PJB42642.1 MAG: NAD-dependent dehydratase [Deltaproteobacteria bacterium CG_4_9_14_3_um_filter_63_12]